MTAKAGKINSRLVATIAAFSARKCFGATDRISQKKWDI
jgi:hypothetical protein